MYYTLPTPMAAHPSMNVPAMPPHAHHQAYPPMAAAYGAPSHPLMAPQPQQAFAAMPHPSFMQMPTAGYGPLTMGMPAPSMPFNTPAAFPMPSPFAANPSMYAAAGAPPVASSPAMHTPMSLSGAGSGSSLSAFSLSTPGSMHQPAFQARGFSTPSAGASSDIAAAASTSLVMPPAPTSSLKIPPQGIKLDGALLATAETSRPILADRFRTKMCRNHTAERSCPYRMRCMFAHTDDELRTPDMNFRDGLYTEIAIRQYQERESAARRRLRGPKTSSSSHAAGTDSTNSGSHARSAASSASSSSREHTPTVLLLAPTHGPVTPVMLAPAAPPMVAFIHQPYAPRPLAQ